MKIVRAKIYLIKNGYRRPVVIRLETDQGIHGIGEAAVAYGLGSTAAAGMLKDFADKLILGKDPSAIESLWSEMYDHSFWAKGGGAIIFSAISAIEQAMWDIKGKALGVPIYELLGGKFDDKLRVYANGWGFETKTAKEFAKAGEQAVRDGFDALKCYPLAQSDGLGGIRHPSRRALTPEAIQLAYERVRDLRSAVGPQVEIMVDLSGGLTTDETIRLCRRYEELNLLFIEEPADPFDIGALKKIAKSIHIPIAAGERRYTRHGFRAVMESRAVDIVQPDIGNTGGIFETKKIAAMAEAYGMRVAPHNCASPLLTAVSLQLSATLPNFLLQEIYPFRLQRSGYEEFIDRPPELEVAKGCIPLSNRPGIGVDLIPEKVAPYLWAECTL